MNNARLRVLKSRLTRTKKLGPVAIIQECERTLAEFEATGYPDCWSDWERAKSDAEFALWHSR